MRRLARTYLRLKKALTQPREELQGAQRAVRYFADLTRHCARELSQDRAEQMAAALSYRTIFALVPVVVLGLVVFRLFGGLEDVHYKVQAQLYDYFGVPDVSYSPMDVQPGDRVIVEVPDPAQEIAEEAAEAQQAEVDGSQENARQDAEREDEKRQVRASIQRALSELTAKISNLDFASIGTFGILLFIYAGLALAIAVEDDFNVIYGSPRGRPWHLRVAIYWSILTLGTSLLALSLYVSGDMVARVAAFGIYDPLVQILNRSLAVLANWVLLFLLYSLLPNTHVHWRPAVVGSLVAALLWETGKIGFQIYVTHALPYSAWYGSLGLIPLFLFWIYISWVIVLFGLELTYTLQVMHGRRLHPQQEETPTITGAPEWFIPMIAQIGSAFDQGTVIGRQRLSEQLGLPSRTVQEFASHLEEAGLIHRIASNDEGDVGFTLARPPEKISLAEVLQTGHDLALHHREPANGVGWSYLDKLSRAQLATVGDMTLSQLLADGGVVGTPASHGSVAT